MRNLLFLIFFLNVFFIYGQTGINGRVINKDTREPLAYAKIEIPNRESILTNIDGSFTIERPDKNITLSISYIGFQDTKVQVNPYTNYIQVGLSPEPEKLQTVYITSKEVLANGLIKKAIAAKEKNDPEKALTSFKYNSYSKFIIDNESGSLQLVADSTSAAIETILNEGRTYLSEKVSEHTFISGKGSKEEVIGIKTAGFEKPVYRLLSMQVNPLSIYKDDYKLFKTQYAGPLGKQALNNYEYKILDTTRTERPAYIVYFKPKRPLVVAGLEGILYLDTKSLAIQRAKAQLLGSVKLEVIHDYTYYPEEELWFPSKQITTVRPGQGGKEIAVFGGTISLGAVQRKESVLDIIFPPEDIQRDTYLRSEVDLYNIDLDFEGKVSYALPEISVTEDASSKEADFWNKNRITPFTQRDEAAENIVDSIIQARDVKRKLVLENAIATGFYPIGPFDVNLGKIFKFNNYEGIRLGLGGKTNERVSEKFNINGYFTYGFKDEVAKYGIGTEIYLNKRQGTNLNFYFSRDIRETASYDYQNVKGPFSLINPRFVNINFFHNYRTYWTGIKHRITPRLDTELRIGREEIWQIQNYAYLKDGIEYADYDLNLATLSFVWSPFSKFLSTPEKNIILEKRFPRISGQIQKSFEQLDGAFDFTRIGLAIDHEIPRLDQSNTIFILEGSYAFGDLPLSHAFHANPNNPNRPEILRRFSVAGRDSFETMYYNEFFSDKQVMLHLKHQLRPFQIAPGLKPELVFISRHVIGDFENMENHLNVEFDSLKHGFSEFGMELNKIFTGFGLSAAYRYGAYHLPTFKENFALKFTLQLEL